MLPVVTNSDVPSLTTPPTDQMPPCSAFVGAVPPVGNIAPVENADTAVVSATFTPTTQPKYGVQSPSCPPYGT